MRYHCEAIYGGVWTSRTHSRAWSAARFPATAITLVLLVVAFTVGSALAGDDGGVPSLGGTLKQMGIDTGLNTVSQMEGAAGTAAGAANTALNVLDAAHSVLLAFGYHVELELQYEPMDVPQAIHLREDPKHVAGRQMWP